MPATGRSTALWPVLLPALGLLGAATPPPDVEQVRAEIQQFKKDPRGPYQGIRWFCPDGSVRPARESCGEPGGLQHALPKDAVQRIEARYGVHLGQILAGTDVEAFLDREHHGSRLKQYQIEKFLEAVDDGWIMHRARYYRGAVQVEDEEAWSRSFLVSLMARDDFLTSQFYLARQIARDLPRSDNADRSILIRGLARGIADAFPAFSDLRVKIHSRPEASDVESVRAFGARHRAEMPNDVARQLDELLRAMEAVYREASVDSLERYLGSLPADSPVEAALRRALDAPPGSPGQAGQLAELIWVVRNGLLDQPDPAVRLAMMDLSNESEGVLFRLVGARRPRTLRELLEENYFLARAAAGAGFLETWEWNVLEARVATPSGRSLPLEDFRAIVDPSLRGVQWGAGMVRAVYGTTVDRFSLLEPLAAGFVADRSRASILLAWGRTAARMADVSAELSGLTNRVLDLRDQGRIRGLNPGIAVGELEVITGSPEGLKLAPDRIYVLSRAPADLAPVAGIATVSEGNPVSHVQLLARNLGIPNTALTRDDVAALARHSGTRVFYAVSPGGTVVIKPAQEMDDEEKALVATATRREEKLTIPTDRADLGFRAVVPLSRLQPTDSGRICGPKAANLARLKALFPDEVPPGVVIPFGVFREHLDQTLPRSGMTYWEAILGLFSGPAGEADQGVDTMTLARLAAVRLALQHVELMPAFLEELRETFREETGAELGSTGVFVRSDTNMEDLAGFTGAGLNLTVPNVRGEEGILQAIRDVWASAFSERSFRWRQRYLTNPQAIYPSVVLLPSVNVEKSGVMITTGIASRNPEDITVAFNWGVGGAVEGQNAETYLLGADGSDRLLSPAREPEYNELPDSGGVRRVYADFDREVLAAAERAELRRLAGEIRRRVPPSPGGFEGPYDVELGFWNGRPWLFQIRPFVENRRARSSTYLAALDARAAPPEGLSVDLDRPLGPD
jgi:Pyruvate phosphate dikinase, AMP/ATP-binding domain